MNWRKLAREIHHDNHYNCDKLYIWMTGIGTNKSKKVHELIQGTNQMVNKMESTEIPGPESIIQKIDCEISLADITVDLGNGDKNYSNFNPDILNEGAFENAEKTMVDLPVIREFLANKIHTHNRSSWKMVEEINMERLSFLLNVDDMLEEMLI
jgi:hypothetical protein